MKLILLLVAASAGVAHAASCQQSSLDVFLAANFQCEVGNLQFSAFSYNVGGNGGFTVPATSEILVTPGTTLHSGSVERWLQFTTDTPWTVNPEGGGNSINGTLSFVVTAVAGNVISGASLTATGYNTSNGSNVAVTDTIANVPDLKVSWSQTNVPTTGSVTQQFAPVSSLTVTKHVHVNGGNDQSAGITSFTQGYFESIESDVEGVPEPSTAQLLVGAAAVALGLLRRRGAEKA